MTSSQRPVVDVSARCACGAVSLHFAGSILSMFLCTCEDCQRATGTGHACVALVRSSGLSVTGSYSSFARPADSGAMLTRHFCGDCGTPLFARSSRAEGLTMLPVGLFGGRTDWYAPGQVIFARSHRAWDALPEGIALHPTYRDGGAAS